MKSKMQINAISGKLMAFVDYCFNHNTNSEKTENIEVNNGSLVLNDFNTPISKKEILENNDIFRISFCHILITWTEIGKKTQNKTVTLIISLLASEFRRIFVGNFGCNHSKLQTFFSC